MSALLTRYTKEFIILSLFVVLTLIAEAYITSKQINEDISDIYLKKLTSLKNSLKVNVESYFKQKEHTVRTVANTLDAKSALLELSAAFDKIESEYKKSTDNTKLIKLIEDHTKRSNYDIPSAAQKRDLENYIPKSINGNILQELYIVQNPFESQDKIRFVSSKEDLTYDNVHKKYHSFFVDILKRYNFYDIFLIDNGGNIVYSVFKELDLGTNLKTGVYKDTSLAEAFSKALKNNTLSFSDFKPYEPTYNKPASFFAIPVNYNNEQVGVIAFQISINDINKIMTFNETWEKIGLGKSGESYLVGRDYFMRSDSRFTFTIENKTVNEIGTTVGILNVKSDAITNAINGKDGYGKTVDYRGAEVLSSYVPLQIYDQQWVLAVEIDNKEVKEHINKIVFSTITTDIIMTILSILILILMVLRLIVKPIENFERNLNQKVEEKTQKLKESTAILNDYKKVVDESSIVSKTDKHGIIKYVNDAFCEISGFKRDELIGKPHNMVRHPDTPKKVFEELWQTIRNKRVWKGIMKNRKKDGREYIVNSTIVPILNDKNEIIEYISIRHDITDLIQKEQKIIEQTTDELTKLPNKTKLLEDISSSNGEMKLAIIQIDKFKELNDFYSREKCDQILIHIASIFKRMIANSDIKLYKIVSGSFATLSDEKTSMHQYEKIVENIIKYCDHNIISTESDTFNISVSAGIAQGSDNRKLYFNAEMALRKAYETSKSLLVFEGTSDIAKEFENNIQMTKKIKHAIQNDNILVYAQPIISNIEGGKSKYECLVRMYDDENDKVLSPFFFLGISKKARLYPTLTKIIIEKSFEHFYNLKDEFSINLSIEDILDESIVLFLKKKIDYYKIGHRVVLEIVESEGINNFDDVHAFIKEFKGYGCKIAIDDFGTGYSNFEYLMKLDVDYIKIDGSLIKNIDVDKNSELIVELIVDFARKMHIGTIAEFIHSDSVYKKVKSMGIDYSQGYYLGEPQAL